MKKDSKLALILDKNLYEVAFLVRSVPYLIFGLVMQSLFIWLVSPYLIVIVIYVLSYVGLILTSGLLAKNFKKDFHQMGWWFAFLLFSTSIISMLFAFVSSFEATLIGFLQFIVIIVLFQASFVASVVIITVSGQRASLREKIGLKHDFFEKEKRRWKNMLERFPSLNRVIEDLDEGQFIVDLFDKGFFNLAVLWSCNVMEKVIDEIVDEIISRNPEKMKLFRTESGRRLSYPKQLRNIGYRFYQDKKKFNLDTLWHKVRNKIAHYNYRPTFEETSETLKILISFTKEMPIILQQWIF